MKKHNAIRFLHNCFLNNYVLWALVLATLSTIGTESWATQDATTPNVGVYENNHRIFTDDAGVTNREFGNSHQEKFNFKKTVEAFADWVKNLLEGAGVLLGFLVIAVIISRIQVGRKIHEIKLKNQALSNSEAQWRTLVETIPDPVWLKAPDGRFLSCNKRFERFLGLKKADIIGRTDYDLVDKSLADFFRKKDNIALSSDGPCINQEEVVFADDGHTELLETVKTTMYDDSGNLIGVLGVSRDISRLKKNQQELRREKEFTEAALNSQRDTFFLFDPVTEKAIRWNHAFNRVTGYTDDEILQIRAPHAYFHPEAIARSIDFTTMVSKTGFGVIELNMICKDGRQIPMEFNVSSMRDCDSGAQYLIAVGRDLTERKKMEEELRQSHKMESIGTLAGGIAHDFNNILSIILGNAELALRHLSEQDYCYTKYEQIKTASLRAKKVVSQLLGFSRNSEQSKIMIDIAPVIRESISLVRASTPASIEIAENIPQSIDAILADPTHIHQVVINLCTNASQAMCDTGGVLEITLKPAGEKSQISEIKPGEYVQLVIRDNGVGIAADIREKIFDPYFTTKPMGDGSGMGLCVVHGIVKNHNGYIFVDSDPGKGTTVSVLFPAVAQKPLENAGTPVDTQEQKGRASILFVDDETSLVEMVNEMLASLGYQISSFTNPLEAFELFSNEPDRFDLVITDLTMPQMDGVELSRKIKQIRPELPIIICTGNLSFLDEEKAQKAGVRAYLSKPITTPEISSLIRGILGTGQG